MIRRTLTLARNYTSILVDTGHRSKFDELDHEKYAHALHTQDSYPDNFNFLKLAVIKSITI